MIKPSTCWGNKECSWKKRKKSKTTTLLHDYIIPKKCQWLTFEPLICVRCVSWNAGARYQSECVPINWTQGVFLRLWSLYGKPQPVKYEALPRCMAHHQPLEFLARGMIMSDRAPGVYSPNGSGSHPKHASKAGHLGSVNGTQSLCENLKSMRAKSSSAHGRSANT